MEGGSLGEEEELASLRLDSGVWREREGGSMAVQGKQGLAT